MFTLLLSPRNSTNELGDSVVKIHGNWCGPNWTAGRKIDAVSYAAAGGQFDEPCIDKLDCACRAHDKDCSQGSCSRSGDTRLRNAALLVAATTFNPQLRTTALSIAAGMEVARRTRSR